MGSTRSSGSIVVATLVAGLCAFSAPAPVVAAGEFTVSPTSLSFPATFVGASAHIDVTISNVSGQSQTPNFSGGAPSDSANFDGSQNCAGRTFAPGDSCTFTYTFEPSSSGSKSTSTTIGIGSDNFSISMSGEALFPITVSPTSLLFPDTAVGASSSIAVTVSNISGVAQTPNYAGGAPIDPTNFDGSQNCAGVTLPGGGSCEFTYTFKPAAIGAWSSSTTIDVDGTSFAISMRGNGIDPTATTTTSPASPSTTTTSTADSSTSPGSTTTSSTTATSTSAPATSPGAVQGPLDASGGRAAVIAQGIVGFPAEPVAWSHTVLDASGWPFTFSDAPASFVAIDGPDAVLVSGDAGSTALLDAGEAAFLSAGSTGSATPMFDGAASTGRRITFVASTGASSFTPGPGRRDVNLIRDVLAPGDDVTVTSPFPVLLVVIAGTVATADGEVLAEGTVVTLPSLSLSNDGTTDAVVLVAAVGGPVP